MKVFSTIPSCAPFCPSCKLLENRTSPPLYLEAKEYFETRHSLPFPLQTDLLVRWRFKARLAVRGTQEAPLIGLFLPGTHEVVDSTRCTAHHEAIEQGLKLCLDLLKRHPLEPYNENGSGLLRYLQLVVERETGKVQLTLVVTRKEKEAYDFARKLWAESSHWHSIWLNIQPEKTNKILGDDWERLEGEPFLWQRLGGMRFAFHPASFSQAHLPLFEKMLFALREYVDPSDELAELYAGMGVMGLFLADKCQKVDLIERNPFSYLSFQETIRHFPSSLQEKIHFHTQNAEDDLNAFSSSNTLLVDPPRKGLDPFLKKQILEWKNLQKLLYVSCNFFSFKRDAEELIEKGFFLKKVEGYLFFPGSDHIEILGYFTKKC